MRKTIIDLTKGVYDYDGHNSLADRGVRRYHPFSFDFDSTSLSLKEPEEHLDVQVKRTHLENRAKIVERLKQEYGALNIERSIKNSTDLGPKSMSLLTYHNRLHEQARRSFVMGLYYPALVAACALGERILNHLVLDLRDSFKSSRYYKKIYRKDSFDNWSFVIEVLEDWKVLVNCVGDEFISLGKLRNRSIHFESDTYQTMPEDALAALETLNKIIAKQFGYFGFQPWFIEDTPGAQFVKHSYQTNPFVQTYIIPRSGFVGPLYGMEISPDGHWRHLDYANYGDEELDDDEFAKRFRERDPKNVVSRELIEQQRNNAL